MTTALVHSPTPASTALASPTLPRLIRPIAAPAEVMQAQEETRALIQEALKDGRDFGKIPGVDKPSLLKPGAERVALAFGCTMRFTIVEKEVDHDREVRWIKRKKIYENRRFVREDEVRGESLGLYRYVVMCELLHRESGEVVGSCLGSCSSMESKYVDRPRDCENTIIKMAEKRALVGATLTTFGLSEQFTQDVEDGPRGEDSEPGDSGAAPTAGEPEPACPKCGSKMWDNRTTKKTPKAPDYKCRDRSCDGVMWPGQWPPKDLATAEQQQRIAELLAKADLTDAEKDKYAKRAASTTKPLTAERAGEMIAYLAGVQEDAASDAGAPDPDETKLAPGKVQDALELTAEGEQRARPTTPAATATPGAAPATPIPATSTATTSETRPAGRVGTLPSITDLSKEISKLLMDKKLTDDERAQYRKELEAAKTVGELESLTKKLRDFLDQPF